ncbi:MAG: flagellar hook capping FlgD N-terminal domain-containing protein, partial [Planctomycetota bacterium]
MSVFPTQTPNPFGPVNPQAEASSGFDSIDSNDFLQIILSELTNQDPLAPNDTQALLDQIGTIRSIESDLELTESLEQIASRTEISSAGSLVGTFVAGTTDNGQEVVGFVDSISIS